MTPRRTGRRPGNQDTRAAIVAAAGRLFASLGYDGTSVRRVAGEAGVDPALVHHYFGTKQGLFLAVVQPPVDVKTVLPEVFAEGLDAVPDRLVTMLLSVWEDPVTGPALIAMVRGAVSSTMSAALVREFFTTQILTHLVRDLGARMGLAEARLRAALVASQIFGLALTRYVLRIEPLARAPRSAVVAAVAPTIRRYLQDPLAPGDVP